jgi:hypothetical protein
MACRDMALPQFGMVLPHAQSKHRSCSRAAGNTGTCWGRPARLWGSERPLLCHGIFSNHGYLPSEACAGAVSRI